MTTNDIDNEFIARMAQMQAACELLNQILPHVGIVAAAVVADSGATWIDAGPLRIKMLPEGWKVARVDSEERASDRLIERLVEGALVLNELLPFVGVHRKVHPDNDQTSLLIGSIRATPVQSGWKVAVDPSIPEPFDLTVPEHASADWNDVLDAAIEARNSWRPSGFLQVIHCAIEIGTAAALDFISNYSDDGSPAPAIAVQMLAEALGRLPEWEATVAAGQFTPAA
jgi:hypothetical protein